jgi:broad specificity phosphatase PhoE
MLILMRHGRTTANAGGLLQGRLDLPLDGVGRAQVASMAERIGQPDRLVSSPLLRARQTAEAFGVPYEVDDRWEELFYGEYEGVKMSDIDPATWARWRGDEDFAPPGGESMRQLGVRVRAACEDLIADAIDRTVVVTSHVSPIKVAVAWALNAPVSMSWRCFLDQAAACRIMCTPTGPMLLGFNETPL